MALDSKMADTSSALHPSVMWAQRKDKLYVTINLEDCKNPQFEIKENYLFFRGKGGTENKDYEAKIEFFKEVLPDKSKYTILPRNIPCVIKKKEEGEFWPRLLKDKQKVHWLKTDFDKWKDEDDSDYDEEPVGDLESMMQNMGGFGGGGGIGAGAEPDAEDSDDEEESDLPDLE